MKLKISLNLLVEVKSNEALFELQKQAMHICYLKNLSEGVCVETISQKPNESDGTSRVHFTVRGVNLDFQKISQATGLVPTAVHRAGDPSPLASKPFPCDAWELTSPISQDEPLDAHLKWLTEQLKPHYSFFISLRPQADISIYWGYISEVEQNDFSLSPESLEIFPALGIPLVFSIIAI